MAEWSARSRYVCTDKIHTASVRFLFPRPARLNGIYMLFSVFVGSVGRRFAEVDRDGERTELNQTDTHTTHAHLNIL